MSPPWHQGILRRQRARPILRERVGVVVRFADPCLVLGVVVKQEERQRLHYGQGEGAAVPPWEAEDDDVETDPCAFLPDIDTRGRAIARREIDESSDAWKQISE